MATTYEESYIDAHGYECRYWRHDHAEGETVVCDECGADVPGCDDCPQAPPADHDAAWAELAEQHNAGCKWVASRAHRLD